jgi:hypothetical protein
VLLGYGGGSVRIELEHDRFVFLNISTGVTAAAGRRERLPLSFWPPPD